tara:strand:+ start:245 stop:463 length:219 start_codon:yes stop_codon:yes gene_type:complete
MYSFRRLYFKKSKNNKTKRQYKKKLSGKKGGNCPNNKRLVYDTQGIIGCNQPLGTPSQGGRTYNYPEKIIST